VAKRRVEPRWLTRLVVDAVHTDQIREHGGVAGIRDENVLESALARPQHKWQDADTTDMPTLAAAYAFGLVKNHPYRDGNMRVGFLAMVTFLGINDHELDASDAEGVTQIVALAAGDVSEEALAGWIRKRTR
jgi:death on curing protein